MANVSLLDLEAELIERLEPLATSTLRVMPTPEDPDEIKRPKTSRVLVAFSGETFQPPGNRINRTASIIQPYEIRFTLILQIKDLRSHQGALPLISQIRDLLTGWSPEVTGHPIYQSATEYISNTDTLWTFALTFVAPAVYVKRSVPGVAIASSPV